MFSRIKRETKKMQKIIKNILMKMTILLIFQFKQYDISKM
jgi:hypothetical protein